MSRILMVVENAAQAAPISTALVEHRLAVDLAVGIADGVEVHRRRPPALVLLVLDRDSTSLSNMAGQVRMFAPTPLVIVGPDTHEECVVFALEELGALDYLVWPRAPRTLVARVHAALRLAGLSSGHSDVTEAWAMPSKVTIGPIAVDRAGHRVMRSGRQVHLSPQEFNLLELLMTPPNTLRSRSELLELGRTHRGREIANTRTLDTHMRRLRRKLEDDPSSPRYLLTVRGLGFIFDAEGMGKHHDDLSVLAEPMRMRILTAIANAPTSEVSVTDFIVSLARSQGTVTHHLQILLTAGVVRRRRDGQRDFYFIADEWLNEHGLTSDDLRAP